MCIRDSLEEGAHQFDIGLVADDQVAFFQRGKRARRYLFRPSGAEPDDVYHLCAAFASAQ